MLRGVVEAVCSVADAVCSFVVVVPRSVVRSIADRVRLPSNIKDVVRNVFKPAFGCRRVFSA